MRPIVCNARSASRPELGGVERFASEILARLSGAPYVHAHPPPALVHRAGHAWEQTVLPARAAAQRAALIFSPANLAPLVWPRNVVVIHDTAALREPRWYSRSYVAWQRQLLPRIARRALHVVTVSEFSRREIGAVLGVDAERVSVVSEGVDPRFSPDADSAPVRAALGLRGPYVLTVGSATARKNLQALGPAARALAARGVELVIAGGGRPQFRAETAAAGLRAVGYVPDRFLPGLYAGALAFVTASLYEGFGLTCLEAMASGVPVVASRRGALPATCGRAAVLVDPERPEQIARELITLVGDANARRNLGAAGRHRAQDFTWAAAAATIDELLRRVAADVQRPPGPPTPSAHPRVA